MNIKAKLVELLPLQTGMGKNGQWRKQDIIVETDVQYPKKLCISIQGDKINKKQLFVGNQLDIEFELESRAYKIVSRDDKIANAIYENLKSNEESIAEDYLPF